MAEIVTQQPGAADLSAGMGTELYTRRSSVKAPEPNPDFSFPRADQSPDERASDQPRRQRIRPQNLSLLPAPEFPPASPVKPDAHLSQSPGQSRPMSSRGMGHRREGSQFIGGDTNAAGSGLMSSSPTKSVNTLPSPPSSVGRRRGHAHRRSGAMSTNDFSAFLNSTASAAPPVPVPGSAPTTPMLQSYNFPQAPHLERAQSQPSMTAKEKIDLANAVGAREDQVLASTPRSASSRPRVGFSEKVEFIPRPLSTISSETTSSISTVRPMHSANNSISSVLEQRPPTPVTAANETAPRTSTDSGEQPFFGAMEEADELMSQRPTSASGKALFAKRRRSPPPEFTRYDDASPASVDQPFYFASETRSQQVSPTLSSPRGTDPDSGDPVDSRRESRGRSLASRLLRRSRQKSKDDAANSASGPSEPEINVPAGLMSLDDINFDEDTSMVIHSAGYKEPVPAAYQPSPSPIKESFDKDDSAALDLDVAYNSVTIDEDSPSSFANIMKGTIRQHRRTESAPSLSPVQRQSFLPSKQPGSPHKMADVFEEEEEEEGSPPRTQRPKAQSFHQPKRRAELQGLGVQIVDAEAGDGVQPRRKSRSPSSKAESTESEPSSSSPHTKMEEDIPDLRAAISRLPVDPRFSMATKSSDEETITPTALDSPRSGGTQRAVGHHDQSIALSNPLDFAPPPSLAPHAHHGSDLSASSSVPSPNATNLSFDGPRLNTAASSITDRTTWSLNPAQSTNMCPEPGHSVEDVPSLTSSASTMMSGHPSHMSHHSMAGIVPATAGGQGYHAHTFSGLPSPAFPGLRPQSTGAERTFSFSGIAPRPNKRTWGSRPSTSNGSKRASLASLSRLMSKGTDSEKSKLSMAWGAQDLEVESKREKESKGKRLSRVLKFWKSKEKLRDAS